MIDIRYIELNQKREVLTVHWKWPTRSHKDGYMLQVQRKHKKYGWQAMENFYK